MNTAYRPIGGAMRGMPVMVVVENRRAIAKRARE